jgi:hypothetical protein
MKLTDIKIIDVETERFEECKFTIHIKKKEVDLKLADTLFIGSLSETQNIPDFVSKIIKKDIQVPLELSFVTELDKVSELSEFGLSLKGTEPYSVEEITGKYCGEYNTVDDTLYEIDCGITIYAQTETDSVFSGLKIGESVKVKGELRINIEKYYIDESK